MCGLLNCWMNFGLVRFDFDDIFLDIFCFHDSLSKQKFTWIWRLKFILFNSSMYSLFLTIIYPKIMSKVRILAISQFFEFTFVFMLFVVSKSYSYVSMQSNNYNKKSMSCNRNRLLLFLSLFIYSSYTYSI